MIEKPTYRELEQKVKELEREIEEHEHRKKEFVAKEEGYRDIIETITDSYLEVDLGGNFINFNNSFCELLGYTKDELRGRNNREFVDEVNAEKIFNIFSKVYEDEQPVPRASWEYIRKDGTQKYGEASVSLIKDDDGKPIGFRGIGRDVTDLKKAEAALRESEQRFRFLFQSTLDCVVILDRELNYIYANQAANNFIGLVDDTIEGKNMGDVLASFPKFRGLWVQRLEQFFKTEEPRWAEDSINIGTKILWSESSLAAIRDAADQIIAVGIIYRDVSKRKQVEAEQEQLIAELGHAKKSAEEANQKLERLATLDGLTQLANRRTFDEYLVREWYRQARHSSPLSIILCDIDYFKRYNDTYGHQTGDECLKKIADILKNSITRPSDLVARYGGEEFVLVLPSTNAQGAIHVAQRIKTNFRKQKIPHIQSDIDKYLTLSMGVSCAFPNHNQSVELLIKAADDALYEVKAKGRNNYLLKEYKS